MRSNLNKLFGRIRRYDPDHADEGFHINPDGEKIRIERRTHSRRCFAGRRTLGRDLCVDRRVEGLERRLGIDWRAYTK